MIKNIVFDLGRVIVDLNQNLFIDSLKYEEELSKILKSIYKSEEWLKLDEGIYTLDYLINVFCNKYPEYMEEIRFVIGTEISNIFPFKKDSIDFVKELKKEGYKIYILSNTFSESFEYIKSNKDFYDNVSGDVCSYKVNMLKPNKEIYIELLNRYNLNPEETIFIDDKLNNIEAANFLGINGIVFDNIYEVKEKVYNIISEKNKE